MRSFAHLLGGILIVVLLMGMLTSCADSSSANPGDRDDLLPPGQEQPGQPVPTDETAITPVPTQTPQAPIMGDIPAPEGMAAFLVASGAPSSGSADQVDPVLFVAGSQLVGEDLVIGKPVAGRRVARVCMRAHDRLVPARPALLREQATEVRLLQARVGSRLAKVALSSFGVIFGALCGFMLIAKLISLLS